MLHCPDRLVYPSCQRIGVIDRAGSAIQDVMPAVSLERVPAGSAAKGGS